MVGGHEARTHSYAVGALLRARSSFHLAYRLGARFYQLTAADAGAGHGAWRILILAFAAWDVYVWTVLTKDPDRFLLVPRLGWDAADIALWSLAPYPSPGFYEPAAAVALPLAIEAGVRMGWRGMVVPAATMAVTAVVRHLAARPVFPLSFWLIPIGVALGIGLARYCDRLEKQAEDEHAQLRAAEEHRAFLAGQNAVAMGASSVVDAIEGVLPVLGRPPPGSALSELADAWKHDLATLTAKDAVYLGTTLQEWAKRANRHPDLSGHVVLQPAPGIGTILLTGTQVEDLWRLLSAIAPRGTVTVDLLDPGVAQRPPGAPITLRIADRVATIPRDRRRPPAVVDPAPPFFLFVTLWLLQTAAPSSAYVPLLALVPGSLLCLAAAWWAHRRLRRSGPAARPAILAVTVGIAVLHAVLATIGIRHTLSAGGAEEHPGLAGLVAIAILGGLYDPSLGRRGRMLVAVGVAAVAAAALVFRPVPPSLGGLVIQMVWPLLIYIPCRRLGYEEERAAVDHDRELSGDDEAAVAAAFARGRETVVELVRRASEEAQRQLDDVGPTLSPGLRDTTRRRLDEVNRRLSGLGAQ